MQETQTCRSISDSRQSEGLPVSPRNGQGIVRYVQGLEDSTDAGPGDVIIVPTASAKWGGIVPHVAEVISMIGGPLSSLGTIARESGTPAVFGVGSDLDELTPGTMVDIDGTHGVVKW